MDEDPPILRPLPRRPFETKSNPASASPSNPPAPPAFDPDSYGQPLDLSDHENFEESEFARSRSVANLTASTLFGIYAPTGDDTNRDDVPTPWGTGAETPASNASMDDIRRQLTSTLQPQASTFQSPLLDERTTPKSRPRLIRRGTSIHTTRATAIFITTRICALFAFGVAYGFVVSKLHENRQVTPVQVEGIKRGWEYLAFWGIAGVGLGSLLPWVDWIWATDAVDAVEDDTRGDHRARTRRNRVSSGKQGTQERKENSASNTQQSNQIPRALDADWSMVVRSIGVFIGIAFAIVSHRTLSDAVFYST